MGEGSDVQSMYSFNAFSGNRLDNFLEHIFLARGGADQPRLTTSNNLLTHPLSITPISVFNGELQVRFSKGQLRKF